MMQTLEKTRTLILNAICLRNPFLVILSSLSRRKIVPKSMRKKFAAIHTLLKNNFSNEGYESRLYPFMNITEEKTFIDVGANIGLHTLRIAKNGVKVIAFEPSPKTYQTLCKNAKNFLNVKTFNYALGRENAEAMFYVYGKGFDRLDGSLYNIYGKKYLEKIKVQIRTMDSFDFQNVGLIKIDTEGNEYNILKGAISTLRRDKPRLVIEVHSPVYENTRLITHLLKKLDYKKFKHLRRACQLFIIAN